jgi:hypothetical protein
VLAWPTEMKTFFSGRTGCTNQTNIYEVSRTVVENKDKDQAIGLEIAEYFILCGRQAYKTHIKSTAIFIYNDLRAEVAKGLFTVTGSNIDVTCLESGMSFLHVKSSMSMKEKLRQIRSAIYVNRREIAHTQLEAVAGADNPYNLIAIFGKGHLAIKAGGTVYSYVTRCAPVEVVPRSHKNCTEEIPVLHIRMEIFVYPISYAITSAGSPVHCNYVATPRYKLGGKWYCSYTELRECHDAAMLPVNEVQTDSENE